MDVDPKSRSENIRYFKVADMTIRVESDLPITDNTFHPKLNPFRIEDSGQADLSIKHHFSLPDFNSRDLGKEFYRKPPWAIFKKNGSWIYLGISPDGSNDNPHKYITFNREHTRADIYHPDSRFFREGNLSSLTILPTDQILLARVLADKNGFYLHSAGAILNGKGLLFVGHSDAGKSTITEMLQDRAEILCDDRNIVRKMSGKFMAYGTWSHGDIPLISPASAPLHAVFFLHQSDKNQIGRIQERKVILGRLLACLIKPFVTADWWNKTLDVMESVTGEIPCYDLEFDRSGGIVNKLMDMTR